MKQYCKYLIDFYIIKKKFLNSAFLPNSNECSSNITPLIYATDLYTFVENNTLFINDVIKGCNMGGNQSKCKISNSNATDIMSEFNESYNDYLQNPTYLCDSFSEFTNNEESLFITGVCYLKNTSNTICKHYNKSPIEGFTC